MHFIFFISILLLFIHTCANITLNIPPFADTAQYKLKAA